MSAKKENLLEVAEQLFYEYGFRGVGLKQIISEAGVATMTLYNHFNSKEQLVAEVLKKREQRYWSYLDLYVASDSEKPFLSAVKAHGKWLNDYSFKGDMFIRAIEDYAGINEEIEYIARSHKESLLEYFEKLAKSEQIEEWQDIAIQFTLLLEGTTSMTPLIGYKAAIDHSMTMARVLVSSSS